MDLHLRLGLVLGGALGFAAAPQDSNDVTERAALESRFASGDKWERARALDLLAERTEDWAWDLILQGLADPRGEVADASQLALPRIPAGLLARLAGEEGLRADDPWVRRRVAEALGRFVPPAPWRLFERALGDRDGTCRRLALWSLERVAADLAPEDRARALRAVKARAKGKDLALRGRALGAWIALDPAGSRREFEDALRSRKPELRAAALRLGPGGLAEDPWFNALVRGLGDKAPAVRGRAVEGLVTLGTAAAARALVGHLEVEQEPHLGWKTVDGLRGLSGLKHRLDPRPWIDWAGRLPEDWRREADRPRGDTGDVGNRSVAFAGLPILSRRVTFLIDLSGSIWTERADGTTRKQVVDRRLRTVLEGLPPGTRFNLVPFTGEPHPWQPHLVEAKPRRVAEAARWFEGLEERGSGNVWGAADLALTDPEVDTLVILTDGAPTGGRHHRLELLVPLFLERTLARPVVVDSILVGSSRRLERFWAELSRGTGGRSVAVDL